MKFKLKISFLFLLFTQFACVDLYDPNLTSDTRRLVVEATLTTALEYQMVYLTYDAGYNSTENVFKNLVRRAKVKITDDKGNEYPFIDEIAPSNQIKTAEGYNYRSLQKFKAEVGRTYQLHIETLEGKKYKSAPEKVIPAPPIGKAYAEFQALFPPANFKGQFHIFVDTQDPADTPNFYKWDSYHVKQINYCREWYIYGSGGSVTQSFVDKCCEPCFEKVVCEDCYELANDRLINGQMIRKKQITSIPFDNTTPYYLVIRQHSLSPQAYQFWSSIKQQSKNSGGLFDATPKSIRGNLYSETDAKEEVLGNFTVSDVQELVYIVDRNRTTPKPILVEEYSNFNKTTQCYPCEESYKRTKTFPTGWRF